MGKQYKIYRETNYIRVIDITTNELFNGTVKDVFVDKNNTQKNVYRLFNVKDLAEDTVFSIPDILKADGSAYSVSEWETFYTENTGNFNGGGTAPTVNTAFVNKAYSATINIAHDADNPNFEIDLVGNLDLTVTGTVNGDSGMVNLYFSATETATINGVKSLSITGDGEMIPVYFIHDTDGIKWYDGRESLPVDTSNLAVKEGTRLYHELSSGYSQTMTNVGVNCVASFIDPATMVGWEIIKANGEKAVVASITNFTDFTTVEPFTTDSVGIGITAKAPSIWVKSDGTITIYNKDGEVKISINADESIKLGNAMTQLSNGNMSLSALWSFGEMFFDSATSSVHTPQYGSFNSGLGTNIDVKLERYDAGVWVVLDGAGNPGNLRANKFLMLSNTTYANDAAADADATLQSGSFYMITGDRTIKRKP